MNRVGDRRIAAAVGKALDLIPGPVLDLAGCDFFLGADPVRAGISPYEYSASGEYVTSYRDTAHCLYPVHLRHRPVEERRTTVVIPTLYKNGTWGPVANAVHEIGHVLHWRMGLRPSLAPVSDYAETNDLEAFAEAFEAWVWGQGPEWERLRPEDRAVFDALL